MHVIRLHARWEVETSPAGQRYLRRFGCPTGLAEGDRVWIAFEGLAPGNGIRLNDEPLRLERREGGSSRAEVTRLLAPRNLLVIEGAAPLANGHQTPDDTSSPMPFSAVRLEISAR